MIARRAALVAPLALLARRAAARPAPDEEMPGEPWFVQSFLDLREDLAAATAAGRRLAVIWQLRGCPPCVQLHNVTLADPAVIGFVPAHFDVVQLDFDGAREVTFPDGTTFAEKPLARRQRIVGPPTVQVFDAAGREAGRLEGFVRPVAFLNFFRTHAASAT
jgi:thioredoxin-related protein